MNAPPSKTSAELRLRIALAGRPETKSVTMVRCPNWDGLDNALAFEGVVLLVGDGGALYLQIVVLASGGWTVSLQPQLEHLPETPFAFFMRRTAELCEAVPVPVRAAAGSPGLG